MLNITRLISIIIAFLCIHLSIQAQPLDRFIKSNAIEVGRDYIAGNIRHFLDNRYKKQKIFWFEGSFTSVEGVKYDNLQIKFNTIGNSIYLKHKGKYYSVASSSVNEFTLVNKGKSRHFRKGFGKREKHEIAASFNSEVMDVLDHITLFPEEDGFQILELSTSKNGDTGILTMEVSARGSKPLNDFRRHLMQRSDFFDVTLNSQLSDFDERTFMEVLIEGEQAKFLKHNYKNISREVSSGRVRVTDVSVYEVSTFYIANRHNEIREVKFSRRSTGKALRFADIDPPKKIPSVRNERRLTSFMRKILRP